MPRDKRVNSSYSDYIEDEQEWKDIRCPICMEHPHNAVLLPCSSATPVFATPTVLPTYSNTMLPRKPTCPLCRGAVTGHDVILSARKFMNSKRRSCSLEACGFKGRYAELRKHARLVHPYARPSEGTSSRRANWEMMEQQREEEDARLYEPDFETWPGLDELVDEGSFSDFPGGLSDSFLRSFVLAHANYMANLGNAGPSYHIQDDENISMSISSHGREDEDRNSRYVSRFSTYSIRPVREYATRSFPRHLRREGSDDNGRHVGE